MCNTLNFNPRVSDFDHTVCGPKKGVSAARPVQHATHSCVWDGNLAKEAGANTLRRTQDCCFATVSPNFVDDGERKKYKHERQGCG